MRPGSAAFLCALAVCLALPASADEYRLRNGEVVRGRTADERSTYFKIVDEAGRERLIFKSDLSRRPAPPAPPPPPPAQGAPAPEAAPAEEAIDVWSAETLYTPELAAAQTAKSVPAAHGWLRGSEGYRRALETAGDGPIAMYFYATWCRYCKGFERGVLDSPKVKEFLARVVHVSVDGDHERKLLQEFGVRGYPSFLVVRGGKVERQLNTGVTPEQFLEACREAGLGR